MMGSLCLTSSIFSHDDVIYEPYTTSNVAQEINQEKENSYLLEISDQNYDEFDQLIDNMIEKGLLPDQPILSPTTWWQYWLRRIGISVFLKLLKAQEFMNKCWDTCMMRITQNKNSAQQCYTIK